MQTQTPTPPIPQVPQPAGATTVVVSQPGAQQPATAYEMYQALQAQRQVLENQLDDLQSERTSIAQRLRSESSPPAPGPDKDGLEARIKGLDEQILQTQAQLAVARQQEALAAAQPGSTTRPPKSPEELALDRVQSREVLIGVLGGLAVVFIGLPIALAYARRIWKKTNVTVSLTPDLEARMQQIERTVEATAVEIERVGEGQRFVTKLLAERAAEKQRIPSP